MGGRLGGAGAPQGPRKSMILQLARNNTVGGSSGGNVAGDDAEVGGSPLGGSLRRQTTFCGVQSTQSFATDEDV